MFISFYIISVYKRVSCPIDKRDAGKHIYATPLLQSSSKNLPVFAVANINRTESRSKNEHRKQHENITTEVYKRFISSFHFKIRSYVLFWCQISYQHHSTVPDLMTGRTNRPSAQMNLYMQPCKCWTWPGVANRIRESTANLLEVFKQVQFHRLLS